MIPCGALKLPLGIGHCGEPATSFLLHRSISSPDPWATARCEQHHAGVLRSPVLFIHSEITEEEYIVFNVMHS